MSDKKDDDKKSKKDKGVKFNPSDYINTEPTLDEVLSIAQRRARGRTMRRFAKKNARRRKISMRRKASSEKLQQRALKRARTLVKDRLAGGKNYGDLAPTQKVQIDKRAEKKKSLINRLKYSF
jgi:hypothetical protein